ncbi:MAG: DNA polymerase IV [Proteobacteria bacterium]|nr:DNA polymerase IV [Pseudomonadota bacterium]
MNDFDPSEVWSRAIILVDMNAFFASVEQLDNPALRGRPVVVTNGEEGSCIITSSYEARAYGIKTGMRLREAKKLCPQLIRCSGRSKRYSEISKRIMAALHTITPDVEVFSVDEAFLDVTGCQRLHGHPIKIAQMTQKIVYDVSGLPCSVGLSGDKTTAKYAAELKKPNGFTVIHPAEAKKILEPVPVNMLCGIGKGTTRFLAQHGVYTCGDMQKLPISVLAKRFGNLGRRIWAMCQGADPDPVSTVVNPPKSMSHSKVLPPGTRDREVILTYLMHMSEKLASRMRRHQLQAQEYEITLRLKSGDKIQEGLKLIAPSHDGRELFNLAESVVKNHWRKQVVSLVRIVALDPQPMNQQLDFLVETNPKREAINKAVDAINNAYGDFTISPARLLKKSKTPDVISPAWKPKGPRETV